MVNFLNRRSLTFIPLLLIGFVMLIWSGPASAAQLKDIRVGEYDKFTRIVFELDVPTANPEIEIRPSGQLLVTFDKASANLIRKIPVERSPHIKDIQIWQRRSSLAALLISNYPNIRIESFRLSRPPRFAVDIFPASGSAEETTAESSAPLTTGANETTRSPKQIDKSTTTESAGQTDPSSTKKQPSVLTESSSPPEDRSSASNEVDYSTAHPTAKEEIQQPSPSNTPPETEETLESEERISTSDEIDSSTTTPPLAQTTIDSAKTTTPDQKFETPADVDRSSTSPVTEENVAQSLPKQRIPDSSETKPSTSSDKPRSAQNRLQLYLVVTLVIITIVILLMLLLMLLTSKHRLSGGESALKPSQRLQNQDKKIEALNSRIREQFKRYDEA